MGVIINPQRTMYDGKATLRIFAKADDVMKALAQEFDFGPRATGKEHGITASAELYGVQKCATVGCCRKSWDGLPEEYCCRWCREGRGHTHVCKDEPPVLTKIKVPYDKDGFLSERVKTYWDLSGGAQARISHHNNLEGAMQSCDRDITCETVGKIRGINFDNCSIEIDFPGVQKSLGLWWLETAQRGGMICLPIVNVDPEEVLDSEP